MESARAISTERSGCEERKGECGDGEGDGESREMREREAGGGVGGSLARREWADAP